MASGDTVLEFTACTPQSALEGPTSAGDKRWVARLQGNKLVSPPQNYNVGAVFEVQIDAVSQALPFFDLDLDPAKTYDVIIKEH